MKKTSGIGLGTAIDALLDPDSDYDVIINTKTGIVLTRDEAIDTPIYFELVNSETPKPKLWTKIKNYFDGM